MSSHKNPTDPPTQPVDKWWDITAGGRSKNVRVPVPAHLYTEAAEVGMLLTSLIEENMSVVRQWLMGILPWPELRGTDEDSVCPFSLVVTHFPTSLLDKISMHIMNRWILLLM